MRTDLSQAAVARPLGQKRTVVGISFTIPFPGHGREASGSPPFWVVVATGRVVSSGSGSRERGRRVRGPHPLPIQHGSDEGVAHEVAIADQKQGKGDGDDEGELERTGQWNGGNKDLQDEDEREVGEVDPVGGIRDVAEAGAFPGKEAAENS